VFIWNDFHFIITIMWIKCTEKIINYYKKRTFCSCNDWHRKIYLHVIRYNTLRWLFHRFKFIQYFISRWKIWDCYTIALKKFKKFAIHNFEDRKYLSYKVISYNIGNLKVLYIYTYSYIRTVYDIYAEIVSSVT